MYDEFLTEITAGANAVSVYNTSLRNWTVRGELVPSHANIGIVYQF